MRLKYCIAIISFCLLSIGGILIVSYNRREPEVKTVSYNYSNSFNSSPKSKTYSKGNTIIDVTGEDSTSTSLSEDIILSHDYNKNFNGDYIEVDEENLYNYATTEQPIIEEYEVPTTSESGVSNIKGNSSSIYTMGDSDAWKFISNGLITNYPTQSFSSMRDTLNKIYSANITSIKVPIWIWSNPNSNSDMSKKSATLTISVNKKIAVLFQRVFKKIYSDPSKPIFNIYDSGFGTWVMRGKMHDPSRTPSAHSYGTTIDINPFSGSFNVNGTVYGNNYGNKPMPKEIWESLPETHNKYHVLYVDSPIVKAFKSEGFYWGGDWTSGTDCMHFGWLGDGCGRTKGIDNYNKYQY